MLQIILETLGEAVIYGILYAITWIISRTLTAAGDTVQSVTAAAAKTSEDRPVIIFFLIISGFISGAMITIIFPERIFKIGSISGISLLITPLIIGMITRFVGRCGNKKRQDPLLMATFQGGALFGLAAAGMRLVMMGWG